MDGSVAGVMPTPTEGTFAEVRGLPLAVMSATCGLILSALRPELQYRNRE